MIRPTVASIGLSVTSATARPAAEGSGEIASGLGSAEFCPGSEESLSNTVDAPPPTSASKARLVSAPPIGQVSRSEEKSPSRVGEIRDCTCWSSAVDHFIPARATALTSGSA